MNSQDQFDALQTYSQYRPTRYDSSGLGLHDRQSWKVAPWGRNRDSGLLESVNFNVFVRILSDIADEGEDTWEIHRFGHWACGWFEIVLLSPGMREHAGKIPLDTDYPVLDEHAYSEAEFEAMQAAWVSDFGGGPVHQLLDSLEVSPDSPLRTWEDMQTRGEVYSQAYVDRDYEEVDDTGNVTLGPHLGTRDDLARAIRAHRMAAREAHR